MKMFKVFFLGFFGVVGLIASAAILYQGFIKGDESVTMGPLILFLPMIFGLKPLCSMFSEGRARGKVNMAYLKKVQEEFKDSPKVATALDKLGRVFTQNKRDLYHEKVDLLIESKNLGCSDEVLLFLMTVENLDIQKLIQKAEISKIATIEIEESFAKSAMKIDFSLWEDSSWKDAIPSDEYDENLTYEDRYIENDEEPGRLVFNRRYWKNCYSDFDFSYWRDFSLGFYGVEGDGGSPHDLQYLLEDCDSNVEMHKENLEEKSHYFSKYSEYLSGIKDIYGESIYLAYLDKELIIGMPLKLCSNILGSSYDKKETKTANSVSLNCKFGKSEGKRGGSTYSHHLWFEDGLLTKIKIL